MYFRLLWLVLAPALFAQSTTVVDNGCVRILDALDRPHQKTAMHKHDFNRVMVYITDGDLDVTSEAGKVDHQHWKAGDVAWSPAGGMHVSENVGSGDLRIVEIEVKEQGTGSIKRDPAMDPVVLDPKKNKLIFENDQVRVFKSSLEVDGREHWHEHLGKGRATVLLSPVAARVEIKGKQSAPMNGGPGDVFWSDGPARHRATNLGVRPLEVVVVELK